MSSHKPKPETPDCLQSELNDLFSEIFVFVKNEKITIDKKGLLARLADLNDVVDRFLDSSYKNRHKIKDAINWADLSCVDTSIVLSIDGKIRWRVQIEEADPNCNDLRRGLFRYLEDHGYDDVLIEFEW